jgi:ligand-binding SRPBCC domain-containing protein
MAHFQLDTLIAAPIELCFDLARNIDVHLAAAADREQKAIAGTTSGLIGLGETVTWEGRYCLMRRQMTSRIVEFDFPNMFADEMQRGAFHHWRHTHRFTQLRGVTTMHDDVDFASPLGPIGYVTDVLFMRNYMRKLLLGHNAFLKHLAENPSQLSGLLNNLSDTKG